MYWVKTTQAATISFGTDGMFISH
eukprot:SAG31_NODE_34506_length_332_cov_0.875536_2_plen_23_part_01